MCNLTCSNQGNSCTKDTDCKSCSGGSTGQCVVAVPPFIVYPPTPDDGEQFVVYPGFESTWSISGRTLNKVCSLSIITK